MSDTIEDVLMFSNKEYQDLMEQADKVISELEVKLSGVSVKVSKQSTKVIEFSERHILIKRVGLKLRLKCISKF
jgi:ElaB/YqjD/DUF883 family membrane-anchored ribosome-binding protein